MEGKLDIITAVPAEAVKDLVKGQIADFQDVPAKYFLERTQKMATTYLNFNTTLAPFDDVKVRQAIGHAIDKKRLVDAVLNGEAYGPAEHGLVPPAVSYTHLTLPTILLV